MISLRTAALLAALVGLGACAAPGTGDGSGPATGRFEARHQLTVTVPEGAHRVRVWFTMPMDDPAQEVRDLSIEAPFPHRVERDAAGNRMLYVEANAPTQREFTVQHSFQVTRSEVRTSMDPARTRPLTDEERRRLRQYLEPNHYVMIDDRIRRLAAEIVGPERNPVLSARRLYDWTLDNITYWVKDPANLRASPVGSTEYCLDTGTGNCTDFHSLWASLARAAGIPTRIVYGAFFKAELDGQDADQSYHCWLEFYAPGIGWIPHDVAVAELFHGEFPLHDGNRTLVNRTTAAGYHGPDTGMVDYYFGNLEERRVTFSVGRDLILSPRQDAGPVNALAKAYVEVDGRPHPEGEGWVRKLTYRELP